MIKSTMPLSSIVAAAFLLIHPSGAISQSTQQSNAKDPMAWAEFNKQQATLKQQSAELDAKMREKVSVAYATKDIKAGQALTKANLQDCGVELRSRPADSIPNGQLAELFKIVPRRA